MSDPSLVFNGGPGPAKTTPVSAAPEPFHIFSPVPRLWLNVVATNLSVGDRYLMLFNATACPANGTAPDYPPIWIPAKSTGSANEEAAQGVNFSTGLVAALSSTETTLTLAVANDGIFKATLR